MNEYKSIYEKLSYIQSKLNVPKTHYSQFGEYYYRSGEDIQNAVKPIAREVGAVCTCSDEIVYVEGRWYVKATARLIDCESGNLVEASAYAGEEAEKKKLDKSQVTGVASSYARKYALSGLFQLDDVKDSDGVDDEGNNSEKKRSPKQGKKPEEEKKELTLEDAKKMQFKINNKTMTIGECGDKQLEYLKKNMKSQEFLAAVDLVIKSRANEATNSNQE